MSDSQSLPFMRVANFVEESIRLSVSRTAGDDLVSRAVARANAEKSKLAHPLFVGELCRNLCTAQDALKRFGVCMTCLYGATAHEPHGACVDCNNTGWRDGQSPEAKERAAIIADIEAAVTECHGKYPALEAADIIEIIKARDNNG